MNIGPNNPSGGSGGGKGRRRRGRRGGPGRPGGHGGGSTGSGTGTGNTGGGGGFKSSGRRNDRRGGGGGGGQRDTHGGIYTRPMDHNYRNGGQGNQRRGGTPGAYVHQDPEPVRRLDENAAPRIFAFIDDLFFLAKIQETARKLNVKVEFVKTDKDILERLKTNGEEKPSLIIFDLNNANARHPSSVGKCACCDRMRIARL